MRVLLAVLCASALTFGATTQCADSPLSPISFTPSTTSLYSSTCQGFAFGDFKVKAASGNPAPEVSLNNMSFDGVNVYLTFNPNLSAPPSGGFEDIYLFFTVTGPLKGIDLLVGGRNTTISEVACSSATGPTNVVCPSTDVLGVLAAYSHPDDNYDSVTFASTSNKTWITKDIGVSPNRPNPNGGANTELVESFQYSDVPEPATMGLIGAALAGLAIARKRFPS